MKKILFRTVIVLVALIILAVIGIHFFLDGIIKKEVETIGPKVTKVNVKLDSISLSLLSGSGKIKGFLLGNPPGFKSASSMAVGTASLAVVPKSILGDKVIIKTINIDGPEITLENDGTSVNLQKIKSNLPSNPSDPKAAENTKSDGKPAKKLEVDEFVITNAKVHVMLNTALGAQSATVKIPTINLKDLGTGPEGITPAEFANKVLTAIFDAAEQEGQKVITDIGKGAQYQAGEAAKKALGTNNVDTAVKGLNQLFKKDKK
jgi:uncharacterized protein involved in outer membrane biogenesis